METSITLENIFAVSEDVVARLIEDELILVPIASGIGDMEDEFYALNETGAEIWNRMDGQSSLESIAVELAAEYNAPLETVAEDVLGLVTELAKRRMLLAVA